MTEHSLPERIFVFDTTFLNQRDLGLLFRYAKLCHELKDSSIKLVLTPSILWERKAQNRSKPMTLGVSTPEDYLKDSLESLQPLLEAHKECIIVAAPSEEEKNFEAFNTLLDQKNTKARQKYPQFYKPKYVSSAEIMGLGIETKDLADRSILSLFKGAAKDLAEAGIPVFLVTHDKKLQADMKKAYEAEVGGYEGHLLTGEHGGRYFYTYLEQEAARLDKQYATDPRFTDEVEHELNLMRDTLSEVKSRWAASLQGRNDAKQQRQGPSM